MNSKMKDDVRRLYEALFNIVGLLNQPQRDAALIQSAGVSLDRALFPLLVRIERLGPIGVVELAGHAGRDYTTVSRQVGKLVSLGLVARREGVDDRRVSEMMVTKKGAAMTAALDVARVKAMGAILADWSDKDRQTLIKLLRRLADDGAEFHTIQTSGQRSSRGE